MTRLSAVVVLAWLAACGSEGESKPTIMDAGGQPDGDGGVSADAGFVSQCEGAEPSTREALLSAGPHEVRETELALEDTSRPTAAHESAPEKDSRTLDTKVWYPADAAGELAEGGPFPLLIWAHGLSSANTEVKWLSEHLVSRGFVVAGPSFPLSKLGISAPTNTDLPNQPGDVSFVIDALLAASAAADHALAGAIDPERIATGGHSLGASTALLVTFGEQRDARVKATVALAAQGAYYSKEILARAEVPLLALHGDLDAFLPFEPHGTTLRDNGSSPFWFARILGGTHTGFTSTATMLGGQPDQVGCDFISEERTDPAPVYEAMGGTEAGFILPIPALPEDAVTCATDPLPKSLSAREQTEVGRLLITAFLALYLGDDARELGGACAFLEQALFAPEDTFTLLAR